MKKELIAVTLTGMVLLGNISFADSTQQLISTRNNDQLLINTQDNNLDKIEPLIALDENTYEISINDAFLKLSQNTKDAFTNSEDITMIPLRAVSEALGYEVKWNAETQSVELITGNNWTQIAIGKDYYFYGRTAPVSLGQEPVIIEGNTFVPLKFVEHVLRAEVLVEDNTIKIVNDFEIAPKTLLYDFNDGLEGFIISYADFPANADRVNLYELKFGYKEIPVIGKESKGIYLAGHNRSDDLFMYTYKNIGKEDGLNPNTRYEMNLSFKIATNVPGGMVGIGGSPGESVYVKAGIVNTKPVSIVDNMNYYRLNLDKANQGNGGEDLALLGNIAKTDGSYDDSYSFKNFGTKAIVETDSEGNAFIVIGTDSGFEGKTEIYIDDISLSYLELAE